MTRKNLINFFPDFYNHCFLSSTNTVIFAQEDDQLKELAEFHVKEAKFLYEFDLNEFLTRMGAMRIVAKITKTIVE